MPVTRLLLLRHGQSAANAGLATASHADIALTALGERQAEAAALRIETAPALVIVSPFARAQATAAPLLARYRDVAVQTWDIAEFTYLDAQRCVHTTPAMRKPMAQAYWARADPAYIDGPDAESFAAFVARLRRFRQRLAELAVDGTVIAVGHGQFFRAYAYLMEQGFEATAAAMRGYRAAETATPMQNGEIIDMDDLPAAWRAANAGDFDRPAALAFLGDAALLDEVLAAFTSSADGQISTLQQASLAQDGATMRRALHRIIPTLGILASAALQDTAESLRLAWHADQASAARDMQTGVFITRLERLLAQAKKA